MAMRARWIRRAGAKTTATAAAAMMAAAAAGCADPTTAPDLEACDDDITLTAAPSAPGEVPTFGWTPSCAVAWIQVTDSVTGAFAWHVTSSPPEGPGNFYNAILPGVVYGRRPEGTRESVPPAELTPGRTYQVTLFAAEARNFAVEVGELYFRP